MGIDELMKQFRFATRDLFNSYFRLPNSKIDDKWVFVERFRVVETLLFQKLVVEAASLDAVTYGHVQPSISVRLRNDLKTAPIMLNRDIVSGYWDHPLVEVPNATEMAFVCFFDFDNLDCCDNQYVRVQICNWPDHPEVCGKHALMNAQYISFHRTRGNEQT